MKVQLLVTLDLETDQVQVQASGSVPMPSRTTLIGALERAKLALAHQHVKSTEPSRIVRPG